jgi:DNA-binding PadR family transcriptional regulator
MGRENVAKLSSLDEDVLTALGDRTFPAVEIHKKLNSVERPAPLLLNRVYPILDRLEQKYFVVSRWEEGHRLYTVTKLGAKALKAVQEYRKNLRNLED